MGIWGVNEERHSWQRDDHRQRPRAGNVRLCMSVSRGSAGSSSGGTWLEARTQRLLVTLEGFHMSKPAIKRVKICCYVYSKEHTVGFGSNSNEEARTDFELCPYGVKPTGPGVRRTGVKHWFCQ